MIRIRREARPPAGGEADTEFQFGAHPAPPEDIARAYINQHGDFVGWDKTNRWHRPLKIYGIAVAVAAVLAAAALVGVLKSGVLHRGTQPRPAGSVVRQPLVDVVQDLARSEVTFDVHLSSCLVKVVAFGGPTSVTVGGKVQNLPQSDSKTFTVTNNLTLVTANSAARVGVYDGSEVIGYYFPSFGPFTLTIHALGKR